jgi:hypothetical protein
MGRPTPSWLYHFTHVDHVESIVRDGLVCDTTAQASGQLAHEVGNREVKERRRARVVDTAPGGVVADYVPFYFTARSLMLYQDPYREGSFLPRGPKLPGLPVHDFGTRCRVGAPLGSVQPQRLDSYCPIHG